MAGTFTGVDLPDVSMLRRLARDQLTAHLQAVAGTKDLVLDTELMRPLDRIAGASMLKENGVDKIYKLEPVKTLPGCNQRIYVVRPQPTLLKYIADQINAERNANIQRTYRILFVPRQLYLCERLLEQEGLLGYVSLDEFALDLIPLDNDLLSLEMPQFLRSFFLEADQTVCYPVSRSVVEMQQVFGAIPNVYGIGRCAQIVYELSKTIEQSEGLQQLPLNSEIGHLFLVDRDCDYVTPLCSQVTYEGLLDDTFGVSSGFVEFSSAVTGKDQSMKLLLTSQDPVFEEIRNRHFSNVSNFLSAKARELQTGYDKRHDLKSVNDMKNFVANDLKDLKQQHKSLSLHVGACEVISNLKQKNEFEEQLRTEHSLLEGVDARDSVNYIEEMINRQVNFTQCLRLLCLLSVTQGGLSTQAYKSLKTQFVHSFGFHQMLTLHNLQRVGLLTDTEQTSSVRQLGSKVAAVTNLSRPCPFRALAKTLKLIPKTVEDINLRNPSDMSYVFSGAYTPLLCKIIEQVLTQEGFVGLEDLTKLLPLPTFSDIKAKSMKGKAGSSQMSSASRVVLVYFIGGCTYSEVAALRFLGKQRGYKFLIATTSMFNASTFLNALSEKV